MKNPLKRLYMTLVRSDERGTCHRHGLYYSYLRTELHYQQAGQTEYKRQLFEFIDCSVLDVFKLPYGRLDLIRVLLEQCYSTKQTYPEYCQTKEVGQNETSKRRYLEARTHATRLRKLLGPDYKQIFASHAVLDAF